MFGEEKQLKVAHTRNTKKRLAQSPHSRRPKPPLPVRAWRAVRTPPFYTREMFNKLAALVGQAPSFPYTLGDPHPGGGWCGWMHHAGTARDDGAPVSVWRLVAAPGDPRLEAGRHGVRRLKTVRWGVGEGGGREAGDEKAPMTFPQSTGPPPQRARLQRRRRAGRRGRPHRAPPGHRACDPAAADARAPGRHARPGHRVCVHRPALGGAGGRIFEQ